ncbi:MAG TPA: hypothetical protein VMV72_01325 [Verrucomicrobiae bacterium]|nr:hypothetical protein [Verrucomicrobiae bacterium]
MNTPNSDRPTMWQRSPTRRFLNWSFSWNGAHYFLITVAVIITVIAAYYAEENLRGRRAWARCREQLEADGATLDWKALIPKPVPDDQNFAATPFIASWFVPSNHASTTGLNYWKNDNYGRAIAAVYSLEAPQKDGYRHFMDLVTWGAAFDAIRAGKLAPNRSAESGPLDRESRVKAAPAVLEGLETNAAVLAELRAVSQRPYARYPVNYDVPEPFAILLPHLNGVRNICRRLQLEACAELAVGQSEEALQDVKLSLRVADSLKGEPFLISYLVRVACLHHAMQPIWEGLAEHAWSDAQLRETETRLQQYDFVADLKPTFDAERSCGIGIIDYIKHTGKVGELTDSGRDEGLGIARLAPSGWLDQEQVSYCRLFDLQMAGAFDTAARRVFPRQLTSNERALGRAFHDRNPFVVILVQHRVLSAMLLPALGRVVVKGATAQVATDQAVLGCALERYRLANGRFPETLGALAPQFTSQLPHDVITGEPYKYRLTKDGRFVLYSVGWNEKDDGGVPGKTLFDEKEGDWVWQYPAEH